MTSIAYSSPFHLDSASPPSPKELIATRIMQKGVSRRAETGRILGQLEVLTECTNVILVHHASVGPKSCITQCHPVVKIRVCIGFLLHISPLIRVSRVVGTANTPHEIDTHYRICRISSIKHARYNRIISPNIPHHVRHSRQIKIGHRYKIRIMTDKFL